MEEKIKSFPLISSGVDPSDILKNREYLVVAINSSGDEIGYALLNKAVDDKPAEMQYVEVLEEYKNKDIGSNLIGKIKDYLKQSGQNKMSVMPVYTDRDSKPFFEKLGFRPKGPIMELDF